MTYQYFMENLLPELIKQSPALFVIALVSIGFLYLIFRYLQSRDKEQQVLFHEAMGTIKENSQVLGQVQSLPQHLLFASSRTMSGENSRDESKQDSVS
jgi:hypothetical protein